LVTGATSPPPRNYNKEEIRNMTQK
jgi:hypothetical protein